MVSSPQLFSYLHISSIRRIRLVDIHRASPVVSCKGWKLAHGHVWALPYSCISRDLFLHQPKCYCSQIHPLLSIPSACCLNQAFFVICYLEESQSLTVPPGSLTPHPLTRKCASPNSACIISREKPDLKEYMHPSVHCSTVYNS